jgi:hypothetical protein
MWLAALRETANRTSDRIAGDSAEIRTKHLPNTNPQLYLYTRLFGEPILY